MGEFVQIGEAAARVVERLRPLRISKPGIYFDLSATEYFADPAPSPSLTQSICKTLLEQSPAHARLEHPRLAPPVTDDDPAEKYDPAKAIGNAAHAIIIGRGKDIVEAQFDSFKTGDAKKVRDAPENVDKVVILSKHLARAHDMARAARAALQVVEWHGAFDNGRGEVAILWSEGDLWFRSLIDWKPDAIPACYDYKSTGMSVAPHTIGSLIEKAGWHIQAAMHERGLDVLEPRDAGRRKFRFLAQENYPPYAVMPVELDEHWLTMGRKKLQAAIEIWRRCVERNAWPAYPLAPIVPEYPAYKEDQWLAREVNEFAATQIAPRKEVPADILMGG